MIETMKWFKRSKWWPACPWPFRSKHINENSRHFATSPLVSPPNDVWKTSTEIPSKRLVTIPHAIPFFFSVADETGKDADPERLTRIGGIPCSCFLPSCENGTLWWPICPSGWETCFSAFPYGECCIKRLKKLISLRT